MEELKLVKCMTFIELAKEILTNILPIKNVTQ